MNRVTPKPGQESVWDYPRPPRIEPCSKHIRVVFNGTTIADSNRTLRVLETSHPPVYYLPPDDVQLEFFQKSQHQSICEFKGIASYYTIAVAGKRSADAAWSYEVPMPSFEAIRNHLAIYPSKVDACYVDNEQVVAQAGDFYGGWITSDIVGPFKGTPGTRFW
jgi:uncharacterized protein (DUF427 family)